MVTLKKLASATGGEIIGGDGAHDQVVSGLTADSNAVRKGELFIGSPGLRVHGASFAAAAVARGAVAVATDSAGLRLLREAQLDLPVLVIDRVEQRQGEIAAAFYGNPAQELRSFAITGTNGKTTTSYMLEEVLRASGRFPALIGGVELRIAGNHSFTDITTPLPVDIQRMLAEHLAAGGSDVVMEVTSHALLQHRTDPIRFSVAGFTHLTQDHLDYHASLEEYFDAKSMLFTPERCDAAVILIDDRWGRKLYEVAAQRLSRVYALAVESELPAGVAGWQVQLGAAEGSFALVGTDGVSAEHECGLPGTYNIANAALAISMALAGGVAAADIPKRISPRVPGRMEVICAASPRVIVDFAHNADALAKSLAALRRTTVGRLIAVTGTAGDRDAGKRFAMGEATAANSEVVIITDDDPHTEDPAQVRAALIEGTVGQSAEVFEIGDRSEAIFAAVRMANDEDTVMIAGRGHWTVQFVGHDLVPLDDREVAREALVARGVKTK